MKRIIVATVVIIALAAVIGFLTVLYGVGKEMNMYRSCGSRRA